MAFCRQAEQAAEQQPSKTSITLDLAQNKEPSEVDSNYDPRGGSQPPSLTDESSIYSLPEPTVPFGCTLSLDPSLHIISNTQSKCIHNYGTHHELPVKGVSSEYKERNLQCTARVPIRNDPAQRHRETTPDRKVKDAEMGAGVGDDKESTCSSEDDSEDDTDDNNGEWSGASDYYEYAIWQAVFPDLELAADMITRMYGKIYPASSKSITRKISAWQERVNTSTGTTENGGSSTRKVPSSNATSSTTRGHNKKRERLSGSTSENIGGEEEEGEDTDESRHKKFKDSKYGNGPAIPTLKLACPFFKMNSSKYCVQLNQEGKDDKYYRTCPGPGFRTITLLKEHLKRKHSPVQCDRCYHIFEVRGGDRPAAVLELENHRQLDEGCPRNSSSMKEGISDSQWAALDDKKTRKGNGADTEKPKSDVEKWKDIWIVLFPNIPPPRTPWYSNSLPTGFSPSSPVQGLHRFLDVHEQMLESKLPIIKAVQSDNQLKRLLEDLAQKSFQLWSTTCRWGENTSVSGSDLLSSWENISSHMSIGQHSSPEVSTPVFPNLEGITKSSASSRINDIIKVQPNHASIPQNIPHHNNSIVPPNPQSTMNMVGDFTSEEIPGAELHTLSPNEYLLPMNGIQNGGRWFGPIPFNDTVNFDDVNIEHMHANLLDVEGGLPQDIQTTYSQWHTPFTHPGHGQYGTES